MKLSLFLDNNANAKNYDSIKDIVWPVNAKHEKFHLFQLYMASVARPSSYGVPIRRDGHATLVMTNRRIIAYHLKVESL